MLHLPPARDPTLDCPPPLQASWRPARSGQDKGADGAAARGMCSKGVHLAAVCSCGTNVTGLCVSGCRCFEALAAQYRCCFQSTVRRAHPCTTCCCPQLRMPCPCSSTHSIIPARTLCISGGTLKKRTALFLKLPPVFRSQVEFEATAPQWGQRDLHASFTCRRCLLCGTGRAVG